MAPRAGKKSRAEVIRTAMAFPMTFILKRYRKHFGVGLRDARLHERELKRYLAVVALNPDVFFAMAGPVDDLWHTFIGVTPEYFRFCSSVAGRYIHHLPAGYGAAKRRPGKAGNLYARFLREYIAVLGEDPPHEVWPLTTKGDDPRER